MRIHLRVMLSLVLLFVSSLPLIAQNEKDNVEQAVRHEDGLFWDAYNRCDVDKMSQFFWPDVEFYHDKGGPTIGLAALTEAISKGLCGQPNYRLRREAIPDTVKFFPLQKNSVTYGAVLSGEHYFFINDNGKPEYRDGLANFFHVWLLKDGTWKMARVVSYNHHAPPDDSKPKEMPLAPEALQQYVGKYKAHSGTVEITRADNALSLTVGGNTFVLHPKSETVFYTTNRDLTFEFVKEGAKVSKIVIREHGAIADEAKAE